MFKIQKKHLFGSFFVFSCCLLVLVLLWFCWAIGSDYCVGVVLLMICIGRGTPAQYVITHMATKKRFPSIKIKKCFLIFVFFCHFHDKNIYRLIQFFILFHRIYFIEDKINLIFPIVWLIALYQNVRKKISK